MSYFLFFVRSQGFPRFLLRYISLIFKGKMSAQQIIEILLCTIHQGKCKGPTPEELTI